MSSTPPIPSDDGFPPGRVTDIQDILLSPPLAKDEWGPSWQPPKVEELQGMLPQYQILRLLGRGGMGAVYQGRQISLDRLVAIKILSSDLADAHAGFADRFQNEAWAMARLSHPGIVTVHDFGETANGLFYIVMEFIEGLDVQKMIQGNKRLHTAQAMVITAHVCDALQYAHDRGIIHRDVKPANIIIAEDGTVKVADFGLAKIHALGSDNAGVTQSGLAMGSPYYVAPEALIPGASVDLRADIYALGVMLYHMLTGKLPQGMFEPPSLQVPGLDPRYDSIIAKALREDRDLRYARASDMRADLDRIVTQPVPKAEAGAPKRGRFDRSQSQEGGPDSSVELRPTKAWMLRVAAFVLVLTMSGWFWWWLTSQRKAEPGGSNTTSEYPKGQWFPVRFQPDDPRLGDLKVTPEGVLKLHHGLGLNVYGMNVAVRANLRRPAGVRFSGMQVRVRGPQRVALHYGTRQAWLEAASLVEPSPGALDLASGEGETTPVPMMLAIVGQTAYGWVNNRPLRPLHLVEPAAVGGISLWSMNGEFSEIECLVLDGLDDKAALKLIGIDP